MRYINWCFTYLLYQSRFIPFRVVFTSLADERTIGRTHCSYERTNGQSENLMPPLLPVWRGGGIISSSAIAERPRDASCLSVISSNSSLRYLERRLLLLVTSASDVPLRTIKFFCILFSSAYSLMRDSLCCKHKCTVTVIHYCSNDRQLIALPSAVMDCDSRRISCYQ